MTTHDLLLTSAGLALVAVFILGAYLAGRASCPAPPPRFGRQPIPDDPNDLEHIIRRRQDQLRDSLDRKSR